MILRHLHLAGLTSYSYAGKLQDKLVRAFLDYKASPSTPAPPGPTIITAEFKPVYTCGRREIGTVSPEQQQYLRQGLNANEPAEFHEALRGGQTTFHGPGQLVAYPVVDLKLHKVSPRCYVDLLEGAVIDTCAHYGITAISTSNPGVWTDEMNKICALGVHLRRNVSSHGIGLNITTDLRWFDRIVACGLEGKSTTSLQRHGIGNVDVEQVGKVFVGQMADRLNGITATTQISEHELHRGV